MLEVELQAVQGVLGAGLGAMQDVERLGESLERPARVYVCRANSTLLDEEG